jgi:hypothetical protein
MTIQQTTDDLIESGADLDLTEEEILVLEHLNAEQIQAYHNACSSYEAMQAYLEHPDTPEAAKGLLDLSGWAEAKEPV